MYRLKYQGDQTAAPELVQALVQFLRAGWKIAGSVDAILPAPPSRRRARQPVALLAQGVSAALNLPVLNGAVKKAAGAKPVKDMHDYAERRAALREAFVVDSALTQGRTLLVLDDLFQSGATLATLTEALAGAGQAKTVYVLAVTKTKA